MKIVITTLFMKRSCLGGWGEKMKKSIRFFECFVGVLSYVSG
jgi:hypothetical protein